MSRYDKQRVVARLSSCPQILDFTKNKKAGRPLQASAGTSGDRLDRWSVPKLLEVTGMKQILGRLLQDEQGQDIAEYAVMLAVILVIVVGTIRLIGTNANTVFSQVASSVQ